MTGSPGARLLTLLQPGDTTDRGAADCVTFPNAYAERFVRTIKESCLNRMSLFGERSLRRAIGEFVEHHHHERNHQGVGNQLLFPAPAKMRGHEPIACRPRLGGLLK